MTSILTNAGAMVALSTLAQTNKNLLETQTQISTGKKVDSAAQNAAVWAVTTVMEADVDGFDAITESLSLGKATVTVARNASEKVTDLLRDMKEKIVTAQGDNVDRAKIQTDIDELRNQIGSIVSAAQFNGLNLIDGSKPEGIEVLSSLDRSSAGVASASIKVTSQDLSSGSATAGTGAEITSVGAYDAAANTATASTPYDADITGGPVGVGGAEFELYIDGSGVGTTVKIAEGTTADEARQSIQQYIAGLGRDDVKATLSGNSVQISNEQAFDALSIELKGLNAGGLTLGGDLGGAVSVAAGISSQKTSSSDGVDAATIQLANETAGDDFDITIGGISLGTFADAGDGVDLAADTAALTKFINDNILGTDLEGKISARDDGTDTVTIKNLTGENFAIEISVSAAAGANGTQLTLETSDDTAAGLANTKLIEADTNTVGGTATGTLEGKGADLTLLNALTLAEGDSFTVMMREATNGEVKEFTYVADADDTKEDVANGLKDLIDASGDFDVHTEVITASNGDVRLRVDALGSKDVYVAMEAAKGGSGSGGLGKLATMSVATASSAAQALDDIEDLIQTSIDAAAAFGSTEKRLDIQADFVDSLVDSMKSGIGALVDTDMEEASARLQALQVQQQLGTQALSIANSGPQNILSLFR